MKKTLIFAGLLVFAATGYAGAAATSFSSDTGSYPAFNTTPNATYPYAAKDPSGIKVATTNFVASRVEEVTPLVSSLTTRTTNDSTVVVGANGDSGLKADLATMGGTGCGSDTSNNCLAEGTSANSKLNAPTTNTTSNCTGTYQGYNVSACGFIKSYSGGAKQWIRILAGPAG